MIAPYDRKIVKRITHRHRRGRAIGARRLGGLAAVVALGAAAMLGTACNAQLSPYAAKVGGSVITQSQLNTDLEKAANDTSFRCLLESTDPTAGYRLQGAGTDTWDSGYVAFVLTHLIDAEAAAQAVKAHHIAEPGSARGLAAAQVSAGLSSELVSSRCAISSASLEHDLGTSLIPNFVTLQLDEDALVAHAAHISLDSAGLATYEHEDPSANQEVCLSGIFVKTMADGDTVAKLAREGKSFSGLVTKYSTAPSGTSSTGALGCSVLSGLSQTPAIEKAVADTKTGSVTAPLAFTSGSTKYIVLEVTGRELQPPLDALNTLFSSGATVFTAAISSTVHHVYISVNSKYGTWETNATASKSNNGFGGEVVPPSGPELRFLVNPAATRGPLQKAPDAESASSTG